MKTKQEIIADFAAKKVEEVLQANNTALSGQVSKDPQSDKNIVGIPDTSPQEINLKSYIKSHPRNTWTTGKQRSDTANKSLTIGELIHHRRLEEKLTIREVAEACGVAQGTVSRWEHGLTRNIRPNNIIILSQILDLPTWQLLGQKNHSNPVQILPDFFEIPVLSRITQSIPVSVSNNEVIDTEYLSAKKFPRPASEYFGFRVTDSCMAPEIVSGDTLICHIQEKADNHSYVIISLDEENAICRKIYAYKNTVLLLAPNDDPIILNSLEIKKRHPKIFGVVVEIRRPLDQQ